MPNQKVTKCPYYITHRSKGADWKHGITCENLKKNIGYDMKNEIVFKNKEELKAWIEMFCANFGYDECPYYKIINKEREDEQKRNEEKNRRPRAPYSQLTTSKSSGRAKN